MPLIVRLGDTSTHGGQVTSSASTVYAEGKLIARENDTFSCPIHGQVIIEGHSSVMLVEGQWVARQGDALSCGATLISGCTKSKDS